MNIYSHSRLSSFEDCPLKYKLSYIDKIEREEEGIEMFVGSRFHETMEELYREAKFKILSLEELLNSYDARWQKEWHEAVVITKKDRTKKDYYNLGKKCIEDYYKRYQPFNQGRVLGLEKEILIDLKGDGKYKLRGYVDRVVQAEDDTYEIHDYKTSGHLPEQKRLDEDRQLALYQIGIGNIWNDVKKARLIWHYVAFDKEMASTRTNEELEKLKKDTVGLIDQIEATEEFLPKESSLCEWCVYPDLCPKRKHPYKVEALPVNKYLQDSGVKLVNAFAKLVAEKRKHQEEIDKIEAEIEEIKEAVIKYSEKENEEVVKGSDHKLKITEKQKITSPKKGTEERIELDGILHESGKWDEVSELDVHAIDKVILEESWDKKLLQRLKKFFTVEVKKSVSLSKLQEKEK